MLKVRVIPCLDVKDGRVVKGVQFVELRDAGDPVEQARAYDAAGADELMFLDITASHEGRGAILDVIARTADVCFMPLARGRRAFARWRTPAACCAPARTRCRSTPPRWRRPSLISACADAFGSQAVVLAIDAKRAAHGEAGRCSPTAGARARAWTWWTAPREAVELGAGEILLTSMDRDGAKTGYDVALLARGVRRR